MSRVRNLFELAMNMVGAFGSAPPIKFGGAIRNLLALIKVEAAANPRREASSRVEGVPHLFIVVVSRPRRSGWTLSVDRVRAPAAADY